MKQTCILTFLLAIVFNTTISAQTVTASDCATDALATYTFTYETARALGSGTELSDIFYLYSKPLGYPDFTLRGNGDYIPGVIIEINDEVQNTSDFYRIEAYYGFLIAIGTNDIAIPAGSTIKVTIPGLIINPPNEGVYNFKWRTSNVSGHESVSFEAPITICNTLSVSDVALRDRAIAIYPNPASNFIKVSGLMGSQKYQVFNVLGKEVGNGLISEALTIDIANFKKGMYFLKLEGHDTLKFIKD